MGRGLGLAVLALCGSLMLSACETLHSDDVVFFAPARDLPSAAIFDTDTFGRRLKERPGAEASADPANKDDTPTLDWPRVKMMAGKGDVVVTVSGGTDGRGMRMDVVDRLYMSVDGIERQVSVPREIDQANVSLVATSGGMTIYHVSYCNKIAWPAVETAPLQQLIDIIKDNDRGNALLAPPTYRPEKKCDFYYDTLAAIDAGDRRLLLPNDVDFRAFLKNVGVTAVTSENVELYQLYVREYVARHMELAGDRTAIGRILPAGQTAIDPASSARMARLILADTLESRIKREHGDHGVLSDDQIVSFVFGDQ